MSGKNDAIFECFGSLNEVLLVRLLGEEDTLSLQLFLLKHFSVLATI